MAFGRSSSILFNSSSFWGRFKNAFLVGLLIFSLASLPLFFFISTESSAYENLLLFEKFAVTVFFIEFFFKLTFSPHRFQYLFSKSGLLDFFCLLPFFFFHIELFSPFPFYFLVFRLFRILSFVRFPPHETAQTKAYEHYIALAEEKLQRIVQKHEIVFLSEILIPLLLLSCVFLSLTFLDFFWLRIGVAFFFFFLSVLFFLKTWLDYRYDVLIVTDRRLIVQDREFFGSKSNNIRYESVSDVVVDGNGFFKWLFGFGSITIKTPSKTNDIIFRFIPDLKDVVHLISRNRQKAFDLASPNKKQRKSFSENVESHAVHDDTSSHP